MKRFNRMYILILLLLNLFTIESNCSKNENGIEISAILPLTGSSAQYGKWQQQGIESAVDEINKKEIIKIKMRYEDSQSDPKTAVSIFSLLANGNSLCALTGVSGIVLAIAPLADKFKYPQINTSGQNPQLAKAGKYTINLVNLADVETSAMAKYVFLILGIKEAAIIYSNAAAGTGAAEQFKSSFIKYGGKIIGIESYDDNKTDFRSQIERVFSRRPKAIFAPGISMNISRVIKQATELGYKTQWLSYSPFEGPEVERIAGNSANGTIFTSTKLDTSINPNFIKNYELQYGIPPELYASTIYDVVNVIYNVYKSGVHSRVELVNTLTKGDFRYRGVSGSFTISKEGTVEKPVLFKIYQNEEFLEAKTQLNYSE